MGMFSPHRDPYFYMGHLGPRSLNTNELVPVSEITPKPVICYSTNTIIAQFFSVEFHDQLHQTLLRDHIEQPMTFLGLYLTIWMRND